MTTNLINNYVNTYKNPTQQTMPVSVTSRNLSTGVEELDTRNYLKPLRGKGRLAKGNIFDSPSIFVKDLAYDVKSLRHASRGQANDHELGKINDIGMKLGGIAIASYLFTKKGTPMTKAMEFVGLGSFFASMALWPKLAIQLPAKLIHGVNVQQEYIDSFGRKKPFYQDPQFLPWDLYTEDEIYKIGDRLGVPKDIPNRRAFIQEKMKKIAVQNNTLWMLTAGFATPVMSALICNKLEKPVMNALNAYNSSRADKLLDNFTEEVALRNKGSLSSRINNVIELNKEQVVDKKLFREIVDMFAEGYGLVTKSGIEQDFNKLLFNNKFEINTITIDNMLDGIRQHFKNTTLEKHIGEVLPENKVLIQKLTDKNLFGKIHDEKGLDKVTKEILLNLRKNVSQFNATHPDKQVQWTEFINIMNNSQNNTAGPLTTGLKSTPASKLTPEIQNTLKTLAGVFDELNARRSVLGKYAYMKVASAPETVLANYWNNVSDDVIELFSITPDEIAKTRHDRELVAKLMREKMESIAADDNAYPEFINKLTKKISKISDILKSNDADFNLGADKKAQGFMSQVDSAIDEIIPKLKADNFEMKNFIRRLVGTEFEYYDNGVKKIGIYTGGTYKDVMKRFVRDRMIGVESSYLRLVNAMDLMRRVATNTNVAQLANGYPLETKEELLDSAIKGVLQDHTSDFATKGYTKRNLNPKNGESNNIVMKLKRVVYQFLGKTPSEQLVDIPMDSGFFQEKMKLSYSNELHPDTYNAANANKLLDKLHAYRQNVLEYLVDDECFTKQYHNINGNKRNISSKFKFNICGIAVDEFFYKAFNQKFNTNKWFKIFGGFAAALTAVTVGAQFFFGKLKNPESIKKDKL